MGGVDLCDMVLALYRIDRRSKKYYLRIVYFLISIAISNARIIYNKINGTEMSLREFQLSISQSMMNYSSIATNISTPTRGRGRPRANSESSLTETHNISNSNEPTVKSVFVFIINS